MSRRTTLLILLLVLIVGALFMLSTNAGEVPTKTIETDVTSGNAG